MAINFDLQGPAMPVYWVLQYCPNGTVASMNVGSGTQLIGPEQFIMAAGVFLATTQAPTFTISSPLMRKLSSNDSIVLSLLPGNNPGQDPITYAALAEYYSK